MYTFCIKNYFYFILYLAITLTSCQVEPINSMDQFYYHIDRATCPDNIDQHAHNRLDRKSDLYSISNICPKSENSNYSSTYNNLLDSIKLGAIDLNRIKELLSPLDWIDYTFLQEANFILYTHTDTIIALPTKFFKIKSFNTFTLSEQFIFIRHLLLNCDKFQELSKPLEENITIDLLFYLFDRYDLKNVFPGLYINLLQIKGTGFITENEVNNVRYGEIAESIFRKEIDHIRKHEIFTQYDIAIGNLSESYLKQEDTLEAINILTSNSRVRESNYINYILAVNYSDIDSNDLAINYFSKLSKSTGGFDLYLNQDLARVYAQKGEMDKAYLHFDKAMNLNGYSSSDSTEYLFTISEVLALIQKINYKLTASTPELYKAYETYKERRFLGAKVFENDLSHHANEFYAFNTENLLEMVFEIQKVKGNIPDSISRYIKGCILESKQKDEYVDLNGYTRKVNDYTKVEDYSSDIYLNHYQDFFKHYNFKENKIDTSLLIKSQAKVTPNKNYTNIHFLKGRYHYWCLYEKNEFNKLFRISISQFEQELKSNYNLLKSNSTPVLPILDIWTEMNLSSSDTVIVYSDGLLNEYPLPSYLNQSIYAEYYKSNTHYLASDLTILSYTSPSTNKGVQELEYNELMGGYTESQAISELYTSDNFSAGDDCTINNFKSAMSSDILHIATHAYSDSIHRLESYIILRDSIGNPTRLYADEILSMPTVPKFVNLSACQTGTGVHMAGAGTYSIARSFLQKGSEAVMKTLWDVDDKATKKFMILFYTKWKEGISCGDALRETKLDFKYSIEYSAPYYWAGFILEGNPNLYISKN